ncbi:hypothetical protein Hypma_008752 [Hypsizygus marmoreus]|uniref:PA domain-containing protein n=1 Tax=Hypsizygus marmoreus TaxID=39966 RepID=A0A369JX64_HYPMA|nr:hypothetical protein Hypma_008752 [Hypsizygus marmoreus]
MLTFALHFFVIGLLLSTDGHVNAESLGGGSLDSLPSDGRVFLTLSYTNPTGTIGGGLGTHAYELTGNKTDGLIDGVLTRFNETSFAQKASVAKWVALFSCDNTTATPDLISNAAKLGARAIIAYSNASIYCVSTGEKPPSSIPIYTLKGSDGTIAATIAEFPPQQLAYYDSSLFDAAADVIDNDLSSYALDSRALLVRISRNSTDLVGPTSSGPPGPWSTSNSGLAACRLDGYFTMSVLLAHAIFAAVVIVVA